MVRKVLRWPLAAVVSFLAFIGIAASATHYLYEPYNPGFLKYPTIVALHVILGGVYLVFAPFQFVKRIRSRHLGYHRWAGRLLVSIGLVVGMTALFMGLVIPFSGWIERVYTSLFGTFFILALVKGFVHIRAGRVASHREWMIRALAFGFHPGPPSRCGSDPGAAPDAFCSSVLGGVRLACLSGGGLDTFHPKTQRFSTKQVKTPYKTAPDNR